MRKRLENAIKDSRESKFVNSKRGFNSSMYDEDEEYNDYKKIVDEETGKVDIGHIEKMMKKYNIPLNKQDDYLTQLHKKYRNRNGYGGKSRRRHRQNKSRRNRRSRRNRN